MKINNTNYTKETRRTQSGGAFVKFESDSRPSCSAFTLIELLAVITITLIIIAVALPGLKAIHATSLQTATRQVTSELQLARQYAITKRTPVRFVICVATNAALTDLGSNHVCRAYSICQAIGDADGNTAYWRPVQDWKFLPDGIVFSDHNSISYNTINLPNAPPIAPTARTLSGTIGGETYFNTNDVMTVTNMAGGTVSWAASVVQFEPTGYVSSLLSGVAGGIRLMTGTVSDPTTAKLIITDTNNWVYVEYDPYSGRVRTRYRDTYQ